jgi:ribosomal protein S18 acetylase RimI-like enzyme
MDPRPRFTLIEPRAPAQLDAVRQLMREYESWLGVDLCFQGFERELEGLPGDYVPPGGRLFLALDGERPAGCAALRRQGAGSGEMKRLFVRAEFRGLGLGQTLARSVIDAARAAGHSRLLLDTLPKMDAALALYRSLGFRPAARYYNNPLPEAIYLSLDLAADARE